MTQAHTQYGAKQRHNANNCDVYAFTVQTGLKKVSSSACPNVMQML